MIVITKISQNYVHGGGGITHSITVAIGGTTVVVDIGGEDAEKLMSAAVEAGASRVPEVPAPVAAPSYPAGVPTAYDDEFDDEPDDGGETEVEGYADMAFPSNGAVNPPDPNAGARIRDIPQVPAEAEIPVFAPTDLDGEQF